MIAKPYFLEAHFYSGGLRHHAFHEGDVRPDWAPKSDAVGFADEFPLDGDHAAVEVRRFRVGDHEITWLAVYCRSVDAKLGDRQNHAGVGVWLCNLAPTNIRNLLYGLTQLAEHLAQNVDVKALEKPALHFQSAEFLPHYVTLLSAFPELGGMPAANGEIVDTQLYYVKCASGVGQCPLLADFLLFKILLDDDSKMARALVLIGPDEAPRSDAQKFKIISNDFDAPAKFVTAIPELTKAAVEKAAQLEAELLDARAQLEANRSEVDEAQSLKKTYGAFANDPLATVLDRIERLSGEVRNMAIRAEQSRPPAVIGWQPSRPPPRPQSQPDAVEYEYNWTFIAVLIALASLAVVLVIAAVRNWP